MKIKINEDQLKNVAIPYFKSKDEDLKYLKETWSKLNVEEKELVLELYKILHPEKRKQIDEGVMDWVQTGLDIGGIFDPTGILDLTNAVIYFSKGDILFGMLSLVAVIPYAGDVIAKPILLAAKAGSKEFKIMSTAVKTKNASKIAEAANSMKGSKIGKTIFDFLDNFNKGLGEKVLNILQKGKKIPIVGKFFTTIEEWIKLFKNAAKEMKIPTKAKTFEKEIVQNGKVIGKMKGTLKGQELVDWKNTVKEMFKPFGSKYGTTAFRQMAKTGKLPITSLSNVYKNIIRVPETRKLMGKTKLFLRFLDHLGISNYVGPDQLEEMVPNASEKFGEFVNTPEGSAAFNEEITPYLSDETAELSSSMGSSFSPETSSIISQFLKSKMV